MQDELRRVVDALPGLIWTALPDGQIDFLNQRWREYTGLGVDEGCGRGRQAAIHPEDLPELLERWRSILAAGGPGEVEARLRRSDGEYRWFLFRIGPLADASGLIVKWCGMSIDIDDRRRSEEAMRAREGDFRSIADSIPALIALMTPEGAVESVNCHALEYYGATLEELKSWAITDTVPPDDLPAVVAAWMHSVDTGEPYDIEHRIRRADGIYRWFHVSGLPLTDAEGNVVRWCVVQTDIDERKRAEEALCASERNLHLIINTIPALAWSARPDGSAEFFNQHYLDYVGLSAEQAKDWGWTVAVHPDDLNGLAGSWQLIRASDKTGESEARLRRFDGEYRWFLFRANPLRDESGNIVKWYGTNTDIDDRKRAEQELRRSEARKGAILNSALDCIVTIDHEGCITEFNPAAESTFGYRQDEVVGKQLADVIIPPPLREEHRRGLARYLATGEARVLGKRVEMTAARADGSEFPVELAISRIPLDGPPSFTGYLRDISERKQSEEALRRSEALLAQAQHVSSTGGFFWYPSTDEIMWSEEVYRIFELDPAIPVTLESIFSRLHPEDIPSFTEMLVRQKRDGGDFEHEHRLLLPDKSVKYLHVVAHATRDDKGQLKYIAAVQDVTQRRLSEEALGKVRWELAHVARVTSLGAMTASIAHEVNQPLSGIITNASTCLRMLAADPPNVEGARETARRTIRDGNRASDVIARLRALFAKRDVVTESVDLNEATREVIALTLSELQSNQVILCPELADDLPPIAGDRVQIQQVILNLLRNASDAMSSVDDRARQLLIRTEREEGDRVRLTVQDTGVGLEPQHMDKLFDAFYTTKNGGMGVGLSVSRSIIESHRGRLWAERNDGPGATFSFSIPCGREGALDAPSPGAIQTPAATNPQQDMRNL